MRPCVVITREQRCSLKTPSFRQPRAASNYAHCSLHAKVKMKSTAMFENTGKDKRERQPHFPGLRPPRRSEPRGPGLTARLLQEDHPDSQREQNVHFSHKTALTQQADYAPSGPSSFGSAALLWKVLATDHSTHRSSPGRSRHHRLLAPTARRVGSPRPGARRGTKRPPPTLTSAVRAFSGSRLCSPRASPLRPAARPRFPTGRRLRPPAC